MSANDQQDDAARVDLTPEPQSTLAPRPQAPGAGEELKLKVEQLEERIAPSTISSQSTGAGAGKVTFNP